MPSWRSVAGRIWSRGCAGRPRPRKNFWPRSSRRSWRSRSRSFEARRIQPAKANSLSLVRFECNDYSVPTEYAHHEVTVVAGIEEVRLVVGHRLVARHPRHWGKEHIEFNPVHYLALLERKPGALDYAKPLENWELPECFRVLRRRQEAELEKHGTREFIKVLTSSGTCHAGGTRRGRGVRPVDRMPTVPMPCG